MTIRSNMATHNLIAVSANTAETAINTEQAPDTTMLCAIGDVINAEPRRETNDGEAHGKEEPDVIYDLGSLAGFAMNFEKAQPQHFAFLNAFGLGVSVPTTAGDGKLHTITPIDGDLDLSRSNPSFTAAERLGKTIVKKRFASFFVDSIVETYAKDAWCKIVGTIKGTGKVTNNITEEIVNAYIDGTSLTLVANGVEGSTAALRLQNVQRIRVELATGVWTEVAYSAVSAAPPAVITITPPGGTHTLKNFKILYIPTESGWMTFPSRVTETPLRVSQMTMMLGGAWNGSAFQGGRALQAELKSLEWTLNNNIAIEFKPGASGLYASSALRAGRAQKVKVNKEFRDYILQQHIDDNDTFGIYVLAQGALYDGSNYYQVEKIFPKVGVLTSPITVDGKRLAEAGDIQVLEDDTYGSVITRVKNLQASYAA